MRNVNNMEDVLDSRDILARIEELEAERSELGDALHDAATARAKRTARKALDVWNASDSAEELKQLIALANQCEGCGDWEYGEALIRDSYFQEYAEQLADDIGAINRDATWPNNCIDWERAARELQMDYTSVEFDGVTYWLRS